MKYTNKEQLNNTDNLKYLISNSAFIYYLHPNYLCCAMIKIITRYDKELESKEKDYSFKFGDLDFGILNKTFILRQNPTKNSTTKTLFERLNDMKKNRRDKFWDCIELDYIEELNPAVDTHFNNYVKGIYQRILPEEFPEEDL